MNASGCTAAARRRASGAGKRKFCACGQAKFSEINDPFGRSSMWRNFYGDALDDPSWIVLRFGWAKQSKLPAGPGRPPTADQIARERLAQCDRHRPVEGGGVDAAAIADTATPQPSAERAAGKGRGDADKPPTLRRIHRCAEVVEQFDVVGRKLAVTGEKRSYVALRDVVHQGEELLADANPAEASVLVHRVTDGLQTELRAQCDRVATPKPEEGALTA